MSVSIAAANLDLEILGNDDSNNQDWVDQDVKAEGLLMGEDDPHDLSTTCVESFRRVDSSGDISVIGEETNCFDDHKDSFLGALDMEDVVAFNNLEEKVVLDESNGHAKADTTRPPVVDGDSQGKNKPGTSTNKKEKVQRAPKRPLSAYNLFFKAWRAKLLADHGSVGFADLGRQVGRKWKALTPKERECFDVLARRDSRRYRREMDAFRQARRHLPCPSVAARERVSSMTPDMRTPSHASRRVSSTASLASSTSNETNSVCSLKRNPSFEGMYMDLGCRLLAILPEIRLKIRPFLLPTDDTKEPKECVPNKGACVTPTIESTAASAHGPVPLPVIQEHASTADLPIPPGSIVTLPDQYGYPRRFRVNYQVYQMPMTQAQSYVGAWTQKQHQEHGGVTTETWAPFIQHNPCPPHERWWG